MKKVIPLLAASIAILSTGGAWALYSGGSDDHHGSGSHESGSGSHDNDNDNNNGGGVIYYPPSNDNGTVVYYPPSTSTGSTDTSIPQQSTGTGTSTGGNVTPSPIASASATPVATVTPIASPSASASPIVYGVLGPCPSAPGTVQPAASPTASASPVAVPQCINVQIPANAATLGTAAYGTNPLKVPANTTVTWYNTDTVSHTVTADDGSFDSGAIAPGQSFSMTFVADDFYNYHCSIHGAAAMSGAIQIGNATPSPTASASPSATPSPSASASASPSPSASPSASPSP
jgi:plastocyanin